MKRYRHAVSALVLKRTNDGMTPLWHILLVHKPRKHDAWQLPQGGLEPGEKAAEAALRELREETGLCIDAVAFESAQTYCYDFPPSFVERFHPVNDGQQLCFVVVEAPSNARVTVDQREVDAFAWVTVDELARYIERPEYLRVIRELLTEYHARETGADLRQVC